MEAAAEASARRSSESEVSKRNGREHDMTAKLFVGNLAYSTMDHQLEQLFSQYGTVLSAAVVLDRQTGRSRGFGFVEYDNETAAHAAIDALNETEFDGRTITVRVAYDRPRGGGGPGGGRGGRDGGSRGGGHGRDRRHGGKRW
jgi:cold-inducible RNA-binding protein